MQPPPFISICIPAFNRADLLRYLLENISSQEYKNYEVVISDNSYAGRNEVRAVIDEFCDRLPIKYFKTPEVLEMGANWNYCMEKASGTWLKMMHDDDFFSTTKSLGIFAATAQAQSVPFVFSAFYETNLQTHDQKKVAVSANYISLLKRDRLFLMKGNYIGSPTVTMVKRDHFIGFTPGMKWLVDMENYLRFFHKYGTGFCYINEPLVCIGIHGSQFTNKYARNAEVEIPEGIILLNTYFPQIAANFWGYDYYWRLIRNHHIQNTDTVARFVKDPAALRFLKKIIDRQNKIPRKLLLTGPVNKSITILSFIGSKLFKGA